MDQLTTKADVDALSMELIASVFQTELIQSAVLAPTIENFSALVRPGADSLKLPKANSFNVEMKQGGEAATAQKLTMDADTLLLDKHAVVQGLIEDIASIQAEPAIVAEYVKRMASAHAYDLDKKVYAQLKQTSASAPDNRIAYAAGGAPTKADFINARKLMKQNNVPQDGRWYLAVNPVQEAVIIGLADFVDADKWFAGAEQAKASGVLGRAYGFTIMSTNAVTDGEMVFYHSSHAGLAFQRAPRLAEQYKLEYLALLVSVDQLYGVKVLDGGKRGVLVNAGGA